MRLKIFTLLFCLFCTAVLVRAAEGEPKKLAVYIIGESGKQIQDVSQNKVSTALIQSGKYQLIERSSAFLAALSSEQMYQQSGSVDDSQITDLGKQFGADFVCVVSVNHYDKYMQITMRMIDVVKAVAISSSEGETGNYSGFMDLDGLITPVVRELLGSDEPTQSTVSTSVGGANSSVYIQYLPTTQTFGSQDTKPVVYQNNIDYKSNAGYVKARKLRNAGWWQIALGSVVMILAFSDEDYYSLAYLGAAAEISGIVCVTVGAQEMSRQRRLATQFVANVPIYEGKNYTLAVGSGDSGAGLSILF